MSAVAPGWYSTLGARWVVVALAACRLDPFWAPGPLEGLPAAPLVAPVYEDPTRSDHYAPTGLLPDDGGLWVWSSEHPLQTRLAYVDGRLAVAARRTGPLGTRRCVAGGGRLPDTVCVGRSEPGGLAWWGGDFAPALPRRAGYADVAADGGRGVVWVLDPVERVVWTLDERGGIVARVAVPESAYRMGRLGADHLWVLSGTEPRLAVLPAAGPPIGVPLVAPQRDAVWDERRGLLWTVGPEDRVVRRSDGPLVGAGSALVGRPIEGLLQGDPRPKAVLSLETLGAVDATAVALAGDVLAVAATGSDHLLLARWAGGPVAPGEGRAAPRAGDPSREERGSASGFTTALLDGGLAPWAVAPVDGGVAVVSRLDDAVRLVEVGGGGAGEGSLVGGAARTVALDDTPRAGAVDLGERLFYGALLWERRPGSDVTCNTCHWEGGTDHRLHPGFREERWEITRPLWGMGAVAPVFSAGHAPTLEESVEGLVRTLDPRLWEPATSPWWLEGREVRVKEGVARLDAAGVRLALLAWLRSRPVPRAPLRAPGEPLSTLAEAGRALFLRDCAACHRAAPTMSGGAAESTGPLVHGAALFAPVGVAPPFTPDGTRVSPLLHPARGGPWFTNGAATTLDDVLRGVRPGAPHAGPGAPGPGYTDDEVGALRAWLLSI